MQRPTFVRVSAVRVAVSSLPPMYTWPTPIKRVIFGLCVFLCISAYAAMAAGLIGLATLIVASM